MRRPHSSGMNTQKQISYWLVKDKCWDSVSPRELFLVFAIPRTRKTQETRLDQGLFWYHRTGQLLQQFAPTLAAVFCRVLQPPLKSASSSISQTTCSLAGVQKLGTCMKSHCQTGSKMVFWVTEYLFHKEQVCCVLSLYSRNVCYYKVPMYHCVCKIVATMHAAVEKHWQIFCWVSKYPFRDATDGSKYGDCQLGNILRYVQVWTC